jgi:hypothetical protein
MLKTEYLISVHTTRMDADNVALTGEKWRRTVTVINSLLLRSKAILLCLAGSETREQYSFASCAPLGLVSRGH